jgi:TDG/mug DNA glycosylase family protein
VDAKTRESYEANAETWTKLRTPKRWLPHLGRFAAGLPAGSRVADLGSGPGWYSAEFARLGHRPLACDFSAGMLRQAGDRAPGVPRLRADLARLPLARASLDAAWAIKCYQHLPLSQLYAGLADLHGVLRPDAPLALTLPNPAAIDEPPPEGVEELEFLDFKHGHRLFTAFSDARAHTLLEGAGFGEIELVSRPDRYWTWITAQRRHTLPDYVAPELRVLLCGLNPSPWSADTGIPFGRPGNRLWPAGLAAGLVEADRDPWHALERGVGFTDLAKRTTRAAAELERAELAAGVERVRSLVDRLAPGVVCFVGLEGWRRAIDRKATAGPVPEGFADRPAYLMPSTSGRNAHDTVESLAQHLRGALALSAR